MPISALDTLRVITRHSRNISNLATQFEKQLTGKKVEILTVNVSYKHLHRLQHNCFNGRNSEVKSVSLMSGLETGDVPRYVNHTNKSLPTDAVSRHSLGEHI